jgi:hypothetical protein
MVCEAQRALHAAEPVDRFNCQNMSEAANYNVVYILLLEVSSTYVDRCSLNPGILYDTSSIR